MEGNAGGDRDRDRDRPRRDEKPRLLLIWSRSQVLRAYLSTCVTTPTRESEREHECDRMSERGWGGEGQVRLITDRHSDTDHLVLMKYAFTLRSEITVVGACTL